MNKCIICVDGGGTKTEVVAFTLDGEEITTKIGGSGNFSFEADKAVQHVFSTVEEVYEQIKTNYECIMIQMGISGYGAFQKKEQFINDLKQRFNTIVNIVDDAKLALYSIVKDQYNEAILILAGTGSACYGFKEPETLLIGGWGHFLGDEGGAFNLVLRALKRMVEDEDHGRIQTELSKKFLNDLQLKNVFEIKKYVYSTTKAEIASHSKLINELADLGDETAKELLIQSANDLVNFVSLAYKRMNLNDDILIGCQGSVILNSKIVNEEFKKGVRRIIPNAKFVEEQERPVKGAYYLGKRLLKTGDHLC